MTVIIASADRPSPLHQTVVSLLAQTRVPDEVLISVPAPEHCSAETRALPFVRVVSGVKGSSCQRNTALRNLTPGTKLVIFLDDDMELKTDYLENSIEFMNDHPDVAAMDGNVILDGTSSHVPVSRECARAIIQSTKTDDRSFRDKPGLYGCNMVVRADVAQEVLFDERLRLYALFEDIDFSVRCRARGNVVSYNGCIAVHLAERSGRVSPERLGFAAVMNSCYLRKKGTLSFRQMGNLLGHHILGNVKGLIVSRKRRSRTERLRQLYGNCFALATLLRSGTVPEEIENIH